MKIRKLLKCGIIACLMLATDHARAAEENKPGASPDVERPAVFDISFPGGTLADFVAHVDKAVQSHVRDAKRPNFLIPDDLKKASVPKIELRSVDVHTLMNAMTMLLRQEYQWQRVGSSSTWVAMSRPPDARKTQAFYIGHLLKKPGPRATKESRGFNVADITTALETVWQMDAAGKPELKYHEDTQMLVIRADTRQIQMAENVLNQLRGAVAEEALHEQEQRAKTAAPEPRSNSKTPRAQ